MSNVAVFVDAGYFYKAGAFVALGREASQSECRLRVDTVLARLREVADEKSGNARFLRVYWYDGLLHGKPSSDQRGIANSPEMKLRLGVVNTQGEQKGVDSLIIMDLVELARNGSLSDAVVLTGDEDIRAGVQLAQSFGVRVHLLGVEPSRGNQSELLVQEADTVTEWHKDYIVEMMMFPEKTKGQSHTDVAGRQGNDFDSVIEEVVNERIAACTPTDMRDVVRSRDGFVPKDIHRPLLGTAKRRLDRELDDSERARLTGLFRKRVEEHLAGATESPPPNTP